MTLPNQDINTKIVNKRRFVLLKDTKRKLVKLKTDQELIMHFEQVPFVCVFHGADELFRQTNRFEER